MQLSSRLILPNSSVPTKYYFVEKAKRLTAALSTSAARRRFAYEQGDFLLALALALKSGMPVLAAIQWLAQSSSGKFAEIFDDCIQKVALGADLQSELEELAINYPDPFLEDLVQKLVAALSLGVAIGDDVMQLSEVANERVNQLVAKQAGANETKMLIPTIFLILPITVLFAVFPSLTMLGIS